VSAALQYFYNLLAWFSGHTINQPMLICDPSRPPSSESLLQRFRLAEPLKGISSNILDQIIDLSENFGITLLPLQIIFPPSLDHSSLTLQ
jgi:hypothetical protein